MEYLKFLLMGVAGGTLSGFLGIGGGILMVPLLIYFTDVGIKAATAISMMQIVFASFFGTIFSYFQKTIIFKYSTYFGLSSLLFSFLGSYLTRYIPNLAIKIIYLSAAIISFILFFFRSKLEKHNTLLSKNKFYLIIPVGAIAGFAAGLLGIGGGFMFVPALIFFFNLPIKIAIGTSLGAILINSIPGLIGKMISVKFDVLTGILVGIGSIAGARIGTYLHKRINPKITRIIFTLLLIIIIIRVIVDISFELFKKLYTSCLFIFLVI